MVNKVKVGDKAPDFSLPDMENRTRSLKEFLGQKVVLAFSSVLSLLFAQKKCVPSGIVWLDLTLSRHKLSP